MDQETYNQAKETTGKEGHFHKDERGVLHKCYHECKATFKQWGFWIGVTISWPLEHALYQHVYPFKYVAIFLGMSDH